MAGQVNVGGLAELLQNVAKPMVAILTLIIPPMFKMTGKAYAVYKKLPANAIKFMVGFTFCFFGGMYPTVFAAVQAAEHGGRQIVVHAVGDLAEEAMSIIEASKKDDEKDEDKARSPISRWSPFCHTPQTSSYTCPFSCCRTGKLMFRRSRRMRM
jgi:hypothetical protein